MADRPDRTSAKAVQSEPGPRGPCVTRNPFASGEIEYAAGLESLLRRIPFLEPGAVVIVGVLPLLRGVRRAEVLCLLRVHSIVAVVAISVDRDIAAYRRRVRASVNDAVRTAKTVAVVVDVPSPNVRARAIRRRNDRGIGSRISLCARRPCFTRGVQRRFRLARSPARTRARFPMTGGATGGRRDVAVDSGIQAGSAGPGGGRLVGDVAEHELASDRSNEGCR